jgi:hypothetical protein
MANQREVLFMNSLLAATKIGIVAISVLFASTLYASEPPGPLMGKLVNELRYFNKQQGNFTVSLLINGISLKALSWGQSSQSENLKYAAGKKINAVLAINGVTLNISEDVQTVLHKNASKMLHHNNLSVTVYGTGNNVSQCKDLKHTFKNCNLDKSYGGTGYSIDFSSY